MADDVQPEMGGEQGNAASTNQGAETAPASEADLRAELDKWKHFSREMEVRAKAGEAAAKRLTEIEDAQKSEQQRIAERADAAEKRAAEAEAKVLRSEVAAAKGVPAGLAHRLAGTTREELEADADDLLGHVSSTSRPSLPNPPAPSAGSGQVGPRTPNEIFASLTKGG